MKRRILSLLVFFAIFGMNLTAQTDVKAKIQDEYDICLRRISNSTVCGFYYDGEDFIPEKKVQGSDHSFYIENPNVYIKVIDKATGMPMFTRCFEFTDVDGYLGVGNNQLEQKIALDGDHWNFFKMTKQLYITVCSETTCTNTAIPLYEIKGKPESVKDLVFLTFKKGAEKRITQVTFALKSKGVPDLDFVQESRNIISIVKKLTSVFSYEETAAMKTKLEAALQVAKNASENP